MYFTGLLALALFWMLPSTAMPTPEIQARLYLLAPRSTFESNPQDGATEMYFDRLEDWFYRGQKPGSWEQWTARTKVDVQKALGVSPSGDPLEQPQSLEDLQRIRQERGIRPRAVQSPWFHDRANQIKRANRAYFDELEHWYDLDHINRLPPQTYNEYEKWVRREAKKTAEGTEPDTPRVLEEPDSLEELERIRLERGLATWIPGIPRVWRPKIKRPPKGQRNADIRSSNGPSSPGGGNTPMRFTWQQFDLQKNIDDGAQYLRSATQGLDGRWWASLARGARSAAFARAATFKPVPI